MRHSRLIPALVAAAALLAGCAGLIQGDGANLVLTRADLPAGFTQATAAPYTDAEVAAAFGLTATQVSSTLQRIDGYHSVFLSPGPIVRLDSTVSLYQGAVRARSAMAFELAISRKVDRGLTLVATPHIGDASQAMTWSAVEAQGGSRLEFAAVYWRRNNALAAVVGVGAAGTVSLPAILRLARIQDEKLRRAA